MTNVIGGVQQPQPFDATLAGRGLSGSQVIVICHRAIGYLLVASVTAASFVIAALRAGNKAVEPELVQLLLQSLLINYGETVAANLKCVPEDDVAYQPVLQALKLYRAYVDGLSINTTIKELLPSSYQRRAVRQKHYVAGREIRKQAQRESVFFGLALHSFIWPQSHRLCARRGRTSGVHGNEDHERRLRDAQAPDHPSGRPRLVASDIPGE